MRSPLLLVLLLVSIHSFSQNIDINNTAATIDFIFLDGEVEGSLDGFEFTGNIDMSDLENSQFSGSVATETLDTNNWLRSRHLRGKKYFDAKQFPKLTFRSNSVLLLDSVIIVTGSLTIKAVSREVEFRFTRKATTLIGSASINTQDYGISIYDERQQNEVLLKLRLPYN